jgi:hypothetical protein
MVVWTERLMSSGLVLTSDDQRRSTWPVVSYVPRVTSYPGENSGLPSMNGDTSYQHGSRVLDSGRTYICW